MILNHHQHHHRYHHHHEGQGDQKIRLGRMGYWKSVQSIGLARQCVSAYQMKQAPARSLPSQSLNKAGRVGEAKSGKQVLGRTRYYRLGFLASLWRYCRRAPIEANVGKQAQQTVHHTNEWGQTWRRHCSEQIVPHAPWHSHGETLPRPWSSARHPNPASWKSDA